MKIICPFCSKDNAVRNLITIKNKNNKLNEFNLCLRCRSWIPVTSRLFTNEAQVQGVFHEKFWKNEGKKEFDIAAKEMEWLINEYQDYFGHPKENMICEIGTGRGNLLKALINKGYDSIGCEISEGLYNKSVEVFNFSSSILYNMDAEDFLSVLKEKKKTPTVLVFWHVIEHIPNCLTLLKSFLKHCKPKVKIIFQTPLLVPEYIYKEHLFFPTTDTYHYIAEQLELDILMLKVMPYNRFLTCVMGISGEKSRDIIPKNKKQSISKEIGSFISQLNNCIRELDNVTKEQYVENMRLNIKINNLENIK